MIRIAFCQTNRLFILLERAETEIHFSMANGMFKMKMDKKNWTSIATVPDLCPTTVKILTHLISRYQLPLKQKLLSQARLEDDLRSVPAWRMFSSNKRVPANRKKGFHTIRLLKNDFPSYALSVYQPRPSQAIGLNHRLITYIDTKNSRHIKKLTRKGTLRKVFYMSEAPSPPRFLFGVV